MPDGPAESRARGFIPRQRRRAALVAGLFLSDTVMLVVAVSAATLTRFDTLLEPATFVGLGTDFNYTEVGLIVTVFRLIARLLGVHNLTEQSAPVGRTSVRTVRRVHDCRAAGVCRTARNLPHACSLSVRP